METIIFGPADFMASINMKSLVVGEQPPGYDVGDAYHYILMRILMAARAYDKQAIDGPYLQIRDVDGYRRVAGRSAALGFDGKWVLHPGPGGRRPTRCTPRGRRTTTTPSSSSTPTSTSPPPRAAPRGAVMLGDEMIDEASRKMALVIVGQGPRRRHGPHQEVRAAAGLIEGRQDGSTEARPSLGRPAGAVSLPHGYQCFTCCSRFVHLFWGYVPTSSQGCEVSSMFEDEIKTPLTGVPAQRTPLAESGPEQVCEDHRPRFLRWLLPTSCASAVPLDHMQEARLKMVAYH